MAGVVVRTPARKGRHGRLGSAAYRPGRKRSRAGLAGADGDRVRSELGDGALSWAVETGEQIAAAVTEIVPAQGEGAHLHALRRATTSSSLRALLLIAGVEPTEGLVGPETLHVARDFARRGVSLDDLLRGIRLGFSGLAAALLDAADSLVTNDRAAEMKRISLLLFQQIDSFTGRRVGRVSTREGRSRRVCLSRPPRCSATDTRR